MEGPSKDKTRLNQLLLYLVTTPQTLGNPGTWLPVNVLYLSTLFWPGEPFQGEKLGFVYGMFLIITATMRLVYGLIVDRVNRKRLMVIHNALCALVVLLYAFIPEGNGNTSFLFFFFLTMVLGFMKGGSCENDSPVLNSLIDDVVDEGKRSGVFGMLGMIVQVVGIPGLLVSAWVFENYWRFFFLAVGIMLLVPVALIALKFEEPKRGAKKQELKEVLKRDDKVYDYKLSRETIKSTVLSPTNVLAFVEGFFTQAILAVPWFLVFSFLQAPPNNLSALNLGLLAVFFGVPGGFFGALGVAKWFNKYANKLRARIGFIILFLSLSFVSYLAMASIPYPHITRETGADFLFIIQQPAYIFLGLLFFVAQVFMIGHTVNQRPILQKVNLPEAQGLIMGANHFLEIVGNGFGVMLSGFLLVAFGRNYALTVLVLVLVGVIGTAMWALDLRYVETDVDQVSKLLSTRARELGGL
ncbi:MAG: MFS transporter [Candidatus Lokiarchaeota archaeon]|nr:MFS transporter [Candidatus Lokiarchaeota archaeon]